MFKRSKHNLSHTRILSGGMGFLLPIGLTEAIPGDAFKHQTSALIRTAPLVTPVMHPVDVRIHHFFVPFRLVWDEWEDFITGGPDGTSTPVFPTIELDDTTGAEGTLADYLGCPTVPSGQTLEVNALPFRCYQLAWQEFFRDQDLMAEPVISTGSGSDTTTDVTLKQICWEKDYFTSARPDSQKGPDVFIPLSDDAIAVTSDGTTPTFTDGVANTNAPLKVSSAGNGSLLLGSNSVGIPEAQFGDNTGLEVLLAAATGVSIRDLRLATSVQRMQEIRSRHGSRYADMLAYYGVTGIDNRLQRPEYLGGGKQTIQFSEVLATAEGTTTEVGDLKGHGIAAMRSNTYQRFIQEHGMIISFMSVRPKTVYLNGLPRMWNRRIKEDFFHLELQQIGQQAVRYKEVQAFHNTPEDIMSWQDRYDEYRRNENTVHGEMRSILNSWHMARDLPTDVALNADFVECNPTARIYASAENDPLYIMVHHKMAARRLLMKHASNKIV